VSKRKVTLEERLKEPGFAEKVRVAGVKLDLVTPEASRTRSVRPREATGPATVCATRFAASSPRPRWASERTQLHQRSGVVGQYV
jgi:hypothetical protein